MVALLNAALAIFTAGGFCAAVWAFRASRKAVGEATWWFLIAFGLLAFSLVLRGLYWDVLWSLLNHVSEARAAAWAKATGGTRVNLLFGALNAGSIFCILKCRLCLIPDNERTAYRWWNAWMHPTKFRLLPWR